MKKTIKRGVANAMYKALAELPLGHLSTEDLGRVMDNMVALSAPYEHYTKLMQELGKRLYDGVDQEKIQKFNEILSSASKAETIEKAVEIHNAARAEYGDIYELYTKQVVVDNSLLNKDIEVELQEIERKPFVMAVLKEKPNVSMASFDLFEPMFIAEENVATEEDFSELDELMK